jgi:hypothetical protein
LGLVVVAQAVVVEQVDHPDLAMLDRLGLSSLNGWLHDYQPNPPRSATTGHR